MKPAPRFPWGPVEVAIGVGAFVLSIVVMAITLGILAGDEYITEDAGDALARTVDVARYADQRLRAAATGQELPEPPRLMADQDDLRLAMWATLVSQVVSIGIVVAATRRRPRQLIADLGMDHYRWGRIWRPLVAAIGAYIFIIAYAILMDVLNVPWLEPDSTVPTEITREGATLVAAGLVIVIGAPLSEEILFRGLVFGGLSRYGFWPAAVASGLLFSLAHFDPGSVFPFAVLGVTMAWLLWSSGTLWDSIFFHLSFNLASYLLLLTEA